MKTFRGLNYIAHLFSSDKTCSKGGGVGAGGIESVGDESSRLSSSILQSIALMLSIESLSKFRGRVSLCRCSLLGGDLCDDGELETISASTDCVRGLGESMGCTRLLLPSSAVSSFSEDEIDDDDDDGVLCFDWITVTDVFVSSSSSSGSGGGGGIWSISSCAGSTGCGGSSWTTSASSCCSSHGEASGCGSSMGTSIGSPSGSG